MKYILSLTLSLLFSAVFAQGSGFRSEGREFYLGYLHPSYSDVAPDEVKPFYKVYALISSFEDNEVSLSYFDALTKKEEYPTIYKLKGRQTTQILLDHNWMKMKNPGELTGEFKSCHIISQRPISVQFLSTGANSCGSYLALPVHAWGKQYVIASYSDWEAASGLFAIIAAYDNTTVTITPTALTGGGNIGVNQGPGSNGTPRPYTVGLNRGQCWFVESKGAGEDDISASIVKADKPVAVIAGHENAFIEGSDVYDLPLDSRDFIVEQMIPFEYWDHTGYITIPFVESVNNRGFGLGEHARVYAFDENVPSVVHSSRGIDLYPVPYKNPPATLTSELPVHYYADSGGKFSIVQYDIRNHGSSKTIPSAPAPSMMTVVPRSSWRNAYQWYIPSSVDERLQAYYVTIIGPKTKWDSIRIASKVQILLLASMLLEHLREPKIIYRIIQTSGQ
jgi:hypothetical protein